ncbi:titin-like [Coccinella septempunctata]|uniref:titin-like n=1 Tax=Coccinella septempunctata TaxID=41139 RepID=UPI001D06410E|nr:titin-like [Coccinella septempunctata]
MDVGFAISQLFLFIPRGRKAKERKSPYKDIDRPAPPLGILPGEGEEERLEEELPPPTWGSNLIEVREPLDLEGPETPPREAVSAAEVAEGVSERSIPHELDAEDPEIVKLLETSFNMEDILAEVDAMEVEEPRVQPDEVDPHILEEQQKFRDIEADLDRHDAVIAEALAALDDDEKRMLMEMEAEEAAGLEPHPKPSPKKEVKVVADDDTVIKVLVEKPEGVAESKEEKKRKEAKAAAEKKRKPPGRTGLNKGKAKGAILKAGEKKEVEEQEKKAKVVETKTGIPSKRPGVPKPKASKVKISAAASEGEIPSEKPSVTGKGKAIPGKGIPRKGIPRKGKSKVPAVIPFKIS